MHDKQTIFAMCVEITQSSYIINARFVVMYETKTLEFHAFCMRLVFVSFSKKWDSLKKKKKRKQVNSGVLGRSSVCAFVKQVKAL